MEKLWKAEQLDSFFQTVSADPVNRKARSNLVYQAVEPTTQPWLLGTEIVTMAPTAEAGMPHTRPPNLICIPVYYPEEALQQTLAHELVHIDQRTRRVKWEDWYEREGWTPLQETVIPDRWLQRCRLNPDTIDSRFWAYKDRYVPLPLYEREDRPNLRQVVVQWWDRETGIKQNDPPRLFQERYGRFPSQPEHPRELSAVEIAKIFQTPADIDSYLRR